MLLRLKCVRVLWRWLFGRPLAPWTALLHNKACRAVLLELQLRMHLHPFDVGLARCVFILLNSQTSTCIGCPGMFVQQTN